MALASRAETLAERWGLELGPAYSAGLSHHWAAQVRLPDGRPGVLKLGVPAMPGLEVTPLACEATALLLFGGHGAVRLLDHDLGLGALLLERADPGTRLATVVPRSDQEATAALVEVMLQLHACPLPDGDPLPELAEEADAFTEYLAEYPPDEPDGPLPARLVTRAAELFGELVRSAPASVVLHGDLHHDNVVAAGRQPWLAIDPHGLVGDPGYDLAAMLYNPVVGDRDPSLVALVPARVEQLAALTGTAPDRVRAWGFVKAVLSELWTWEDGESPGTRALDVAELLYLTLA